MLIARQLSAKSPLLFVLAFGLLVLPACDSGGSNGDSSGGSNDDSGGGSGSSSNNVVKVTDNLNGNLTLKVDGTDDFYQWAVQEVDRNDNDAVVHNADKSKNVNGTDKVDVPSPSELGGGSSDPSGFDEYEIAITDKSNADKNLSVTLLKDGTEIANATDALKEDSDFVNQLASKGDWAIEVRSP